MTMRTTLFTILLAGSATLLACGGDSIPAPAARRAPANPGTAPAEVVQGVTRGGGMTAEQAADAPPSFKRVGIKPSDPTALVDLDAVAELATGSPYTDVSFVWLVNDRSVLGFTKKTLPASMGAFKKGDRVRIRARARDEEGREAIMESTDLVILNSTPEIITELSDAQRMDGVRLKARDPDEDDKLTWSVLSGPPGVSIGARGRITVRRVNLKQEWKGEVVFSVNDPDGASSELHIPVSISAATDGYTEEHRQVKQVEIEKMDRSKLDAAALDDAEQVSKMNDEEFKKYMDAREKRGGPQ
jgi:hypothetical protein